MNDDNNHLELLVFFYRLLACLALFCLVLSVLGFVTTSEVITHSYATQNELNVKGQLSFFSWAPVFTSVFGLALSLAFALSFLAVSECLRRRKGFHLCLVFAGFTCFFVPIGTVLGVYGLKILSRQTIRDQFGVE